MLLRMDSDGGMEPELLGSFVVSQTPPEAVARLIISYRARAGSTIGGFSFISPVPEAQLGLSLSEVTSFAGLKSFASIRGVTEAQSAGLGRSLLSLTGALQTDDGRRWCLFAFRLFRDLPGLAAAAPGFADALLRLYSADPGNLSLFAISFLLVRSAVTFPALNPHSCPGCLLMGEAAKSIPPNSPHFDDLWTSSGVVFRCQLRFLANALDSVPIGTRESLLAAVLDRISRQSVWELIHFMRRVLRVSPGAKAFFGALWAL
jgi:hypothetical protein